MAEMDLQGVNDPVLVLQQALYGLRGSGRWWQDFLARYLKDKEKMEKGPFHVFVSADLANGVFHQITMHTSFNHI